MYKPRGELYVLGDAKDQSSDLQVEHERGRGRGTLPSHAQAIEDKARETLAAITQRLAPRPTTLDLTLSEN